MNATIDINVKLFGPAVDAVGRDELTYCLVPPAELRSLLDLLYAKYPALAGMAGFLRFAINEEYALLDTPLQQSDEVAIIPPVSGGHQYRVLMTRDPISPEPFRDHVLGPSCGALICFEGVVRAEGTPDHPLLALEYSAYEPMAYRQLCRIRQQAIERFDIHQAAIAHRLGRIEVGTTSLVVVVASPHRACGFEAIAWIIDAIKLDVPIWKREIWAGQPSTWTSAADGRSEL